MSHTHAGFVEKCGHSQWELFSVIDNKSRGSQQRMMEKFHYTAESWQRSMEEREREIEGTTGKTREMESKREGDIGRDNPEEGVRLDEAEVVKSSLEFKGESEGASERGENGMHSRVIELEERVRELEEERHYEMIEKERLEVKLQQAVERANELQQRFNNKIVPQKETFVAEQQSLSWEVNNDELEETNEVLGVGGWAVVKVAKLKVAAKYLHTQLTYDFHKQLFKREMDIAARVNHPNLLRFLGARLEGDMVILTEFMPTSLRAFVKEHPEERLPLKDLISIAINVACALDYLHNMTPDAIIHRDLSSANVLLKPSHDGGWLAKVSDYGTANFQNKLNTRNPGSPVYIAPEADDPTLQTAKMDIYSFGVLLVEMCTFKFPVPEFRPKLIEMIYHPGLLNLIKQCLNEDRNKRPTAAELCNFLQTTE